MREDTILSKLVSHGAIITGKHFVDDDGMHGTSDVNMLAAAHDATLMDDIACSMAMYVDGYSADVVLGPETMGRTLSPMVGFYLATDPPAIWCNFVGELEARRAVFSPKLNFGRFIQPGTRVAIVDDLLTTGGSIRLVADLVRSLGGIPVVAVVAVRRTPDVVAYDCHAEALQVLVGVEGYSAFTESECRASGPCSLDIPIVLRPGQGHEWIK